MGPWLWQILVIICSTCGLGESLPQPGNRQRRWCRSQLVLARLAAPVAAFGLGSWISRFPQNTKRTWLQLQSPDLPMTWLGTQEIDLVRNPFGGPCHSSEGLSFCCASAVQLGVAHE